MQRPKPQPRRRYQVIPLDVVLVQILSEFCYWHTLKVNYYLSTHSISPIIDIIKVVIHRTCAPPLSPLTAPSACARTRTAVDSSPPDDLPRKTPPSLNCKLFADSFYFYLFNINRTASKNPNFFIRITKSIVSPPAPHPKHENPLPLG